MKSLFKGLCLVLALLSTTGLVNAKESTTTQIDKSAFSDKTVNLNKADANTLRYYLKGIGEVKAAAIVQYRKENGKFSSIKDLLNVPGIGDATFKGLQKNVSTSKGETTAPKLPSSGAKSTRSTSSSKSKLSEESDEEVKSDASKDSSKKSTSKSKLKLDKETSSKDKSKLKKLSDKDDKSKTDKKKAAKKSSSKVTKCDSAKDKDCKAKVKKKPKKSKTTKSKKAKKSKPKTKKKKTTEK